MTDERFKFNGANNCIEYDGKSILLDSYGEDIAELLNELSEENERLKGEIQGFIKGIQETAKVSADGIMKKYRGDYE